MCFLKDDVFVAWPRLGARVFHFSSATLLVWLVEVGSDPAVVVILLLGAENTVSVKIAVQIATGAFLARLALQGLPKSP